MTLLDRSIARQFLLNFVVLTALLFSIVVAIDLSLQFDRYIQLARRYAEARGMKPGAFGLTYLVAYLLWDFWWPQLLQLFNYVLGLLMTAAMGFTCTRMVRAGEMGALLAGGISLYRVAAPMLAMCLGLIGLAALNQEVVIPRIASLLTRDHAMAGQREMGAARVPLCADGRGNLLYARWFNADRGQIEGLWFWERDENGRAIRRTIAARAEWDAQARVWRLTEGRREARTDGAATVEAVDSLATDLDPVALTMRRFAGYRRNLSWGQIGEMVARPELLDVSTRARLDELERFRYGRLATMASNLLGVLISLPFFLRREPANMTVQAVRCAPIAIVSLIGGVFGSTLGVAGVPPQLSVFIVPGLVLLPLAIGSLSSVRT